MNVAPRLSPKITQEVVDRLEKKIEKKNLRMLELFLKKLTRVEFEPPEVCINFIKLLSKAELSDKELYLNALMIFRVQIGLPSAALEENVFLVASDRETVVPFSKDLLMKFSNYYKTMFSSGLVESQTNHVQTMLSKRLFRYSKNTYMKLN